MKPIEEITNANSTSKNACPDDKYRLRVRCKNCGHIEIKFINKGIIVWYNADTGCYYKEQNMSTNPSVWLQCSNCETHQLKKHFD